ncbi:MAG: hypothetical protein ABIH66_03740 [bacterium]
MKKESPYPRAINFPFLVIDASAVCVLLYALVRSVFLYREGLLPAGSVLQMGAACIVYEVMAAWWMQGSNPLRMLRWLANGVFLFTIAGFCMPWFFTAVTPEKGVSTLWMPLEWLKAPSNLLLMKNASPVFFYAFWSATAVVIFMFAGGRKRRWLPAALISAFIVFYTYRVSTLDVGARLVWYLLFAVPYIVIVLACLTGGFRFASRLLVASNAVVIVILFYVGVFPLPPSRASLEGQGFEFIYPPPGERSEIDLQFLRGLIVDSEGRYLYSSYGPTSGVFQIDLETRDLQIHRVFGVCRHLYLDEAAGRLYALDWLNTDLMKFRAPGLELEETVDIFDGTVVSAVEFSVTGGKLYLVSSDYPALSRYDLRTLRKEAHMNFHAMGLTRFRGGAWTGVPGMGGRKIFVEMGAVDLLNTFLLLRIDITKFALDKKMKLPEGGLGLAEIPGRNKLLAASFFTGNIYQIDERKMRVDRVIGGPLTCRKMAFDMKSGLLFALGFTRGRLHVIDLNTGDTVRKLNVGGKGLGLHYRERDDELYLGTSAGIMKIKVSKLFESSK